MKNLGDILGQNRGYQKLLTGRRTLLAITSKWPDIAGRLSTQLIPVSVNRRVLLLETQNPMWKTELAFYEDQLLAKIQAMVPKAGVKRLRVSIASPESKKVKKVASRSNLTLEEKIRLDVQRKVAKGWHLCQSCSGVYVEKIGVCDFCRISSQ